MQLAIQCCSKWRFPAPSSSVAPRIPFNFVDFTAASRDADFYATFQARHQVYLLSRAPGLSSASQVDPVSVDVDLPNVLNLYLKPHFMASVLADLGLIPSNWAEHI